jgi:hypothetical protein
MEMTLYKTIGDIEWYQVSEIRFEGFNKKLECYDYTLDKDICGLWILRGQGKDATGRDEQVLMDSIKN